MKRVPRIIIAFDTRWGWGRGFLRGIASFADRHGPWDCDFTVVGPLIHEDVARINESNGLISHINTPQAADVAKHVKVPLVTLELGSPTGLPNVYADPVKIGRMAADHFVERGFRRFAFCAFHGSPVAVARGKAFVEAVESHGYRCEWLNLKSDLKNQSWRPDHLQVVNWIGNLQKPVAIFCVGDSRAREIAAACRDANVQVPRQVAILGIDNDELLCRLCSPQLSSIDAGAHTVGYEAARLLQRALDGHPIPEPIAVPPVRVVTRESSDVVSVEDPRVAAAVRYIRDHIGEGVNVKQLMQHVPVSRRKLEQLFREILGRTIHEEINLAKLHRATGLLLDGNLPLAEIARRCGINHPSHLNSLIKQGTGMTPMHYRRAYQQKQF